MKIAPNDRDARKKLEDCEKTVRRLMFEDAIAAEHKDVFASLKVDDIGKRREKREEEKREERKERKEKREKREKHRSKEYCSF